MEKKRERRGFTLIELMVVILIVGILAAVAVPILRGKIDAAKWSEAAATAGAIRSAVRAAYAEDPTEANLTGTPSDGSTLAATLGFRDEDLAGRYFNGSHFTVSFSGTDPPGVATVTVTNPADLTGSGLLDNTGWTYNP